METAKQLFDTAQTLPTDQRAALAAWLIESLDSHEDESAQSEWNAEIQRRIEELDSGEVVPIPWSKARQIISGQV